MIGYTEEEYDLVGQAGCVNDLLTCSDEILIAWAINLAKEDESMADAMIDFRLNEWQYYVPLKPMFHEPIRRRGNATCVYK